jgi:plasmid stability protein
MANLTIRGLDDATKTRLRVEAARQGYSMEEAARRILRRALMPSDAEEGGLGSRLHRLFEGLEGEELALPPRSAPRGAPDLSEPAA